jgi:hypothetical protein
LLEICKWLEPAGSSTKGIYGSVYFHRIIYRALSSARWNWNNQRQWISFKFSITLASRLTVNCQLLVRVTATSHINNYHADNRPYDPHGSQTYISSANVEQSSIPAIQK